MPPVEIIRSLAWSHFNDDDILHYLLEIANGKTEADKFIVKAMASFIAADILFRRLRFNNFVEPHLDNN